MKRVRKIIHIDEERCDGCGQCIPSCAEGAIHIVDGKAKIIKDMYCDGLGACLGHCPQDALTIVEREADDFDEEAVEKFLAEQKTKEEKDKGNTACGCPSAAMHTFAPMAPGPGAGAPQPSGSGASALTHWPIKIRLVPPTAPFLKGADLLVLADCVATSLPTLHGDLLKGKVVMMGCPKFDDVQGYTDKFVEIFKVAGLKSITVARMEVPCCSGLPALVDKALELSGETIPVEEVVISRTGLRVEHGITL